MTSFIEEMDKLAAEIANKATGDAIALDVKIDAFKALVPYYAQQMKRGKPDDDSDLNTFDNFQNQILASETRTPAADGGLWETDDGGQKPRVRGSRRNGNGN